MAFNLVWGTGFEMGTVPDQSGVVTWGADGGVNGSIGIGTSPMTGSYSLHYRSDVGGVHFRVAIPQTEDLGVGFWTKPNQFMDHFITLEFVSGKTANVYFYNYLHSLYVNGSKVADGSQSIGLGAYYNVQVRYSAGIVQVRVNGLDDISYDLASEIVKAVNWNPLAHPVVNSGEFDDLVIGTGDWPGDLRFERMVPNGDTAVHAWLPNGFTLQPAPAAPTPAVGAATGLTGTYKYKVTLVDPDGESLPSAASSEVTVADQKIDLSAIATGDSSITARKIYRTAAGGNVFKLTATINDNTTTTYTDSTPDASLGAEPTPNTHYDKIDEVPPSDSDYIYSATDAAEDIHALSWWQGAKKSPKYIVHWVRAWKTTADQQSINLLHRVAGGTTLATDSMDIPTSAEYRYAVYPLDPDGNPWTEQSISDLEAGVRAVVPA